MFRIICDYCGEETTFAETASKPESCSNCNSFFDGVQAEQIADIAAGQVQPIVQPSSTSVQAAGLTLIYQTTGERIEINHADRIVLGRTQVGAEVFGKIPHISRSHCVIEFVNGRYVVTDLGSTNGTFLGVDRVDCKANPEQPLDNNGLLFLGQEPFLILVKQVEATVVAESSSSEAPNHPAQYRCKTCGSIFDTRDDICPQCGTFDSMERV